MYFSQIEQAWDFWQPKGQAIVEIVIFAHHHFFKETFALKKYGIDC